MPASLTILAEHGGRGRGRSRMWLSIVFAGLAAFIACFAAPSSQVAHAALLTVDTTDDELNADGDCSLREAIQATNADASVDACDAGTGADTIELAAATYTLAIAGARENANATGDLDIRRDLTINGALAATTVIDAAAVDRAFHIDPSMAGASVAMSDLTVRNGAALDGDGGGILNAGALTLTSSSVKASSAQMGGGIANRGRLTLTDSAVTANAAGLSGGGIDTAGDRPVTLTRTTLSGNTAGSERGGGIANAGSRVTLTNATVSGNSAAVGGAVINDGAISLIYSTVAGNSSGITSAGFGTATLKGTIAADNPEGDCSGSVSSAGHNLIEDASGCAVSGDTTGNIIGADPRLGPLQDNGGLTLTRRLLGGSPAINAGGPDCPPPTVDQRGIARRLPVVCDIGSYEVSRCWGALVDSSTLIGSGEADVLNGTEGDDVIVGYRGGDSLNGEGGDDLLCGGPGNDAMNGGPGEDSCGGGAGLGDTAPDCERVRDVP